MGVRLEGLRLAGVFRMVPRRVFILLQILGLNKLLLKFVVICNSERGFPVLGLYVSEEHVSGSGLGNLIFSRGLCLSSERVTMVIEAALSLILQIGVDSGSSLRRALHFTRN